MRAVGGHTRGHAGLEQCVGDTEGRTLTDRDGHQLPISVKIIDLASIRPPSRLVPAVRRDGPFPIRSWNRFHVDFKLAGLVRRVSHQTTVRRKVAMHFLAW